MASLAEVYERKHHRGGHASPRRVVIGISLFLVGAAMIVAGLILASTEILSAIGVGRFESRRIAGLLGGLGVPAVFIGILTVLPAGDRVRAAAAVGAAVAVTGVVLFWLVYPEQWLGAPTDRHYTFETATIYFIGALITFWCFFVAVVNFKTRNDPGGTVAMEVKKAGRTRVVEVERDRFGFGSIGLFGSGTSTPSAPRPTHTVSDGGTATSTINSPLDTTHESADDADVITTKPEQTQPVDRYCGNCRHFDYVRDENGMQPYCGYHRETMSDVEPCDSWEANRPV